LKLRRNWVVEELVSGFIDGRKGLLEFARNSAELERKKLEEDESPRPKKRRKIQAPKMQQCEVAAGAERRSTRSQSRRDAVYASQESVKEQIVADSDDAGSEYEEEGDTQNAHPATKPQPAQEEPADGLVACPGCGKRMKEEAVFTHLDHCASIGGSEVPDNTIPPNGVHGPPSQQPRATIAYTPSDSLSSSKARERLPTLAYSMLNDTALRKKLQALGISSQGPKLLLQKRHTEWVNLWNANCDSRDPKPKRRLLEELDVWERTQGRQISQVMNAAAGGGQGTGVMAKDFDGESWMRSNKNDFEELVRRAREKKARAPSAEEKQNEPERGPRAKSTAQEIFRNASASTEPNGDPSDVASDTEPEAGVGASTAKSPFFAASADKAPKTEGQDDMLRTSPSKPSMDLEQSQSQGSRVNGVYA
jgi:E3 ubiquitin-protein ligase RAD18